MIELSTEVHGHSKTIILVSTPLSENVIRWQAYHQRPTRPFTHIHLS